MKYYLDTEFIEYPNTIDLISIALVSEDGRELYCESTDFNESKASDWVKENVIKKLWSRQKDKRPHNKWFRDGGIGGLMNKKDIKSEILRFIDPNPEFVGYYCSYDWVVFCWLFGTMMDLPQTFLMYCYDIVQLMHENGIYKIPFSPKNNHVALDDARWTKEAHEYILSVI